VIAQANLPALPVGQYAERADVQAWVQDMALRHGLDPDAVMSLMAQAQYLDAVLLLNAPRPIPNTPAPAPKSWRVYRERNVDARIAAGLQFWAAHREVLDRAEQEFGVPASVIVAIAGIETVYGRVQGNFRVLDTLATLAFDWPADAMRNRSRFFRDQLEELILLTRFEPETALEYRGSFAGAIGIGQFMPSSMRRFAIDYDGDSLIDPRNSADDAIGSIANFLKAHGWIAGVPTLLPGDAAGDPASLAAYIAHDLVARFSSDELRRAGAHCAAAAPDWRLGLVDLPTPGEADALRCAASNFFVITQYNRSFFYAAAVSELALSLETLDAQRQSAEPVTRYDDDLNPQSR
jgi:membrane-bound lytic murein transglycosylase B